jgi:hypothetical protein
VRGGGVSESNPARDKEARSMPRPGLLAKIIKPFPGLSSAFDAFLSILLPLPFLEVEGVIIPLFKRFLSKISVTLGAITQ